jgi:hypothetical protein
MAAPDDTTTTTAAKKRGGARAGAGRPAKAHVVVAETAEALDFLAQVYRSSSVPMPLRIRAAGIVVGATVARPAAEAALGKKAQALIAAADAVKAGSTFAPGRPPLSVVQRGS